MGPERQAPSNARKNNWSILIGCGYACRFTLRLDLVLKMGLQDRSKATPDLKMAVMCFLLLDMFESVSPRMLSENMHPHCRWFTSTLHIIE